ncbi:hypothetical protein G6F31_019281 [Rhizopus arrhizus]|nr:hypothetical protein G6F31_019281 [Rhizopus arrhizus]
MPGAAAIAHALAAGSQKGLQPRHIRQAAGPGWRDHDKVRRRRQGNEGLGRMRMPLHQFDHDRAGRPRIHAAAPAGLPRDLRPVPHRLRQEVAAFRTLGRNHLAIRRERVGGKRPRVHDGGGMHHVTRHGSGIPAS